jgi:hypothetical protein
VIHNNQPYRFPIFETSATALCGTGIPPRSIAKHWDLPIDQPFSRFHLAEMIQATPVLWNGWITVQILRI